MRHDPEARDIWPAARPASGLPAPLDCETLALLRRFLVPILEESDSWDELAARLDAKGYGLAFREGHLVILNERGVGLCTGRMLGVPLRRIAQRIGRPVIRASIDGHAAALR